MISTKLDRLDKAILSELERHPTGINIAQLTSPFLLEKAPSTLRGRVMRLIILGALEIERGHHEIICYPLTEEGIKRALE